MSEAEKANRRLSITQAATRANLVALVAKILGLDPRHLDSVLTKEVRDVAVLKRVRIIAGFTSNPHEVLHLISPGTVRTKKTRT